MLTYELLMGAPPFEGPGPAETLVAIMRYAANGEQARETVRGNVLIARGDELVGARRLPAARSHLPSVCTAPPPLTHP